MPVSPIDFGRYGHPEMISIFEEEYRHSLWLKVEVAVAEAQAELGLIPKEAAKDIQSTAKPNIVTLAPIPSPSVSTATSVNAGLLRSWRNANIISL